MANMYIAEFATTGGVNGGAPTGATGGLPALPWLPNNASFTVGANPNFRRLQTFPIGFGIMGKPDLQDQTDTIAIACDAGNTVSQQLSTLKGIIAVTSAPTTVVGVQNLK